jgi:hypothetical protein
MNYMERAFAPAIEKYRAEVMADTWGHLGPEPRRAYRGSLVFVTSEYGGDRTIVRTNFPDLPDSPWFYEDMNEWMFTDKLLKLREGGVYEFTGTYTKRKNGTFHFKGRIVERMPPAMTSHNREGEK